MSITNYPETPDAPASSWYQFHGEPSGSLYTVSHGDGLTSLSFFPPPNAAGVSFSLNCLTEADVRGLIAILEARLPVVPGLAAGVETIVAAIRGADDDGHRPAENGSVP